MLSRNNKGEGKGKRHTYDETDRKSYGPRESCVRMAWRCCGWLGSVSMEMACDVVAICLDASVTVRFAV